MTSVVALDGETSFLRLKDAIFINLCDTRQLFAGFLQCNGGKLEEAEVFKCVFVVYSVLNWNRSALVRALLSSKSLFVGQLYEDK